MSKSIKSEFQRINIDVPRHLWRRVEALSELRGIDKKSVVTAALVLLLQENNTDV
ncbi:hypothetical protein EDF88_5013 [Buttiauxella sp. BIGb0552]|uniref:hypothetical protein n=1 Tax=Buttiauxella sp. BIGb0552 TaxID=2485120 RepID=UPI0010EAF9C0|nr:hypothetical protein [Buttiauxella sp. BIGb0552]TDX09598.1 hypothetical protein EDF88_5013 [Buttiauxella sp. BIGb0552]